MNELKNKEIIAGLIVIIILGIIALFLLVRRELQDNASHAPVKQGEMVTTEDIPKEAVEEQSVQAAQAQQPQAPQEEAGNQGAGTEKGSTGSTALSHNDNEADYERERMKYTLYSILGRENYTAASMKHRSTEDGQLKELHDYWDAYKLDAVSDLVRLERIRNISEELKGSSQFYYYGQTDPLGRPYGKGLAVYEDNTFYFGSWKEGLRDGKGMWLQVAIYDEDKKYANLGVIEHSYNGEWKKDLPNGEGQEHFSYDYDVLKEDYLVHSFCISNVLGTFKDGYYHGEMYVMTTDEAGETRDWSGECNMGSWIPVMKGKTTDAIWTSYDQDEQGNHSYHYIRPSENKNYGILGLKK